MSSFILLDAKALLKFCRVWLDLSLVEFALISFRLFFERVCARKINILRRWVVKVIQIFLKEGLGRKISQTGWNLWRRWVYRDRSNTPGIFVYAPFFGTFKSWNVGICACFQSVCLDLSYFCFKKSGSSITVTKKVQPKQILGWPCSLKF